MSISNLLSGRGRFLLLFSLVAATALTDLPSALRSLAPARSATNPTWLARLAPIFVAHAQAPGCSRDGEPILTHIVDIEVDDQNNVYTTGFMPNDNGVNRVAFMQKLSVRQEAFSLEFSCTFRAETFFAQDVRGVAVAHDGRGGLFAAVTGFMLIGSGVRGVDSYLFHVADDASLTTRMANTFRIASDSTTGVRTRVLRYTPPIHVGQPVPANLSPSNATNHEILDLAVDCPSDGGGSCDVYAVVTERTTAAIPPTSSLLARFAFTPAGLNFIDAVRLGPVAALREGSDVRALRVAVDSDRVWFAGRAPEVAENHLMVEDDADRYHEGIDDIFLLALSRDFDQVMATRYLGGANSEELTTLRAKDGLVFVAGSTSSPDFAGLGSRQPPAPPTECPSPAAQNFYGGGPSDGFIVVFSATESAPRFRAFVGGRLGDEITDLALGEDGRVFALGETSSRDFPLVPSLREACRFAAVAEGVQDPEFCSDPMPVYGFSEWPPVSESDVADRSGDFVARLRLGDQNRVSLVNVLPLERLGLASRRVRVAGGRLLLAGDSRVDESASSQGSLRFQAIAPVSSVGLELITSDSKFFVQDGFEARQAFVLTQCGQDDTAIRVRYTPPPGVGPVRVQQRGTSCPSPACFCRPVPGRETEFDCALPSPVDEPSRADFVVSFTPETGFLPSSLRHSIVAFPVAGEGGPPLPAADVRIGDNATLLRTAVNAGATVDLQIDLTVTDANGDVVVERNSGGVTNRSVPPDQILTHTLTVRLRDSDRLPATNVVVTLELSGAAEVEGDVTLQNPQRVCPMTDNNKFRCQVGTIRPGEPREIVYRVTPRFEADEITYSTSATVRTIDVDFRESNDIIASTIPVEDQSADFEIITEPIGVSDTRIDVVVINRGPAVASGSIFIQAADRCQPEGQQSSAGVIPFRVGDFSVAESAVTPSSTLYFSPSSGMLRRCDALEFREASRVNCDNSPECFNRFELPVEQLRVNERKLYRLLLEARFPETLVFAAGNENDPIGSNNRTTLAPAQAAAPAGTEP